MTQKILDLSNKEFPESNPLSNLDRREKAMLLAHLFAYSKGSIGEYWGFKEPRNAVNASMQKIRVKLGLPCVNLKGSSAVTTMTIIYALQLGICDLSDIEIDGVK